MGFQEVDNKERRHCGDRGEGGLEDAKLTRRSQGQGTLASEWFSNVFQATHHRDVATMEGSGYDKVSASGIISVPRCRLSL